MRFSVLSEQYRMFSTGYRIFYHIQSPIHTRCPHRANCIERKLPMSAPKKNGAQKKRTPLQRVLRAMYIILFAVSLVVVVGYVGMRVFAPAPTIDNEVHLPIGPKASRDPNNPDATFSPEDYITLHRREGVYTCLLLGVADLGGSDTIMLGVFDTNTQNASLISIPRDTAVRYDGSISKINATYSYGGLEATRDAVSNLLGIPIDYYVSVNVKAFGAIVDEIGGVYFDVPCNMNYEDPIGNLYIHIKQGYQLLDGKKAIGVVRCRNCYSNADIGRSATQRAFLTALVKQTVTLSNVSKVTDLINILNTYVESDMPLNTMVYFGTQAVGMDLDTSLTSKALEGTWKSPYIYHSTDEVLELVNSLGIYEEELPASALNIIQG